MDVRLLGNSTLKCFSSRLYIYNIILCLYIYVYIYTYIYMFHSWNQCCCSSLASCPKVCACPGCVDLSGAWNEAAPWLGKKTRNKIKLVELVSPRQSPDVAKVATAANTSPVARLAGCNMHFQASSKHGSTGTWWPCLLCSQLLLMLLSLDLGSKRSDAGPPTYLRSKPT